MFGPGNILEVKLKNVEIEAEEVRKGRSKVSG
jgi:hypothetical protein